MKPLLLVDVDGVINVRMRPGSGGGASLEAAFSVDGFDILVPSGVHDRIARLEEVFECVWCTTWERDAPSLLAPRLGFGADWPVIAFDSGSISDPTWKLRQVQAWCEENAPGRPVAWVDDDLGPDADEWAARRPDTLVVMARDEEGLTEDQTNDLLAWGRSQANTSGPRVPK